MNKTILFSGRFDPPHISHIDTIMALGQTYQKVLIVILDHDSQMYPVQYRAKTIRSLLDRAKGEYEVVINQTHFGEITPAELDAYEFDVYGSGNMECLKHIGNMGYEIEYVQRSGETSATDARVWAKVKKIDPSEGDDKKTPSLITLRKNKLRIDLSSLQYASKLGAKSVSHILREGPKLFT